MAPLVNLLLEVAIRIRPCAPQHGDDVQARRER